MKSNAVSPARPRRASDFSETPAPRKPLHWRHKKAQRARRRSVRRKRSCRNSCAMAIQRECADQIECFVAKLNVLTSKSDVFSRALSVTAVAMVDTVAGHRLRYWKYTWKCQVISIFVLLCLSIACFLVGSALPGSLERQWRGQWGESAIRESTTEWERPPRIGRSGNGSFPDEEDEGTSVEWWIPSINNTDAVLFEGARPQVELVGPIITREYVQRYNASVFGGLVQFYERPFRKYVGGPVNASVNVPNLPLAFATEIFKRKCVSFSRDYQCTHHPRHRSARRDSGVLLPGSGAMAATTLEGGAVPLLSSDALRQLRHEGDEAIKKAAWPAMILAVCNDSWTAVYNTTQSTYSSLGEWWALAEGDADEGLCTLEATRGSSDDRMSAAVAEALWSFSDEWSVARWSSMRKYEMINEVTDGRIQEAVSRWGAHFASLDGRYTASATLAEEHFRWIRRWMARLLTTDQDLLATSFEERVAALLHSDGAIDAPSWEHVFPAQLGGNDVLGWARSEWSQWQNVPDLMRNKLARGASLLNQCPSAEGGAAIGASIADQEGVLDAMVFGRRQPEFSCWSARSASELAERAADELTPPQWPHFYSRLTSTQMLGLLRLVTTGGSIEGFDVPGSSMALQFRAAALEIRTIAGFYGNIISFSQREFGLKQSVKAFHAALRTWKSASPNSAVANQSFHTMQDAVANITAHRETSTVRLQNERCEGDFVPLPARDLSLTCYQLFDWVAYLDYVARELAWRPRFMRHSRDPTRDSGMTFGGSGPFIRVPAVEVLTGIRDPFYEWLTGREFVGVARRTFDDEAAWLQKRQQEAEELVRARVRMETGGNMERIDSIHTLDGERSHSIWGTPITYSGKWTVAQIRPNEDRKYQDTRREPDPSARQLTYWSRPIYRPADLEFDRHVPIEGSSLHAWQFRLSTTQDGVPRVTSDFRSDAPFCFRALESSPDGPQGTPWRIDLLWGQPYYRDCPRSVVAEFGMSGIPQGWNESTQFDTSLVVEPISGRRITWTEQGAFYLRLRPTNWYSRMQTTIPMVAHFRRITTIPPRQVEEVEDSYVQLTDLTDKVIPRATSLAGGIFLSLCVCFICIGLFPPGSCHVCERGHKRNPELARHPVERRAGGWKDREGAWSAEYRDEGESLGERANGLGSVITWLKQENQPPAALHEDFFAQGNSPKR